MTTSLCALKSYNLPVVITASVIELSAPYATRKSQNAFKNIANPGSAAKIKTTDIVVNKNAIPDEIREKIDL